jgi:hypothetical protein
MLTAVAAFKFNGSRDITLNLSQTDKSKSNKSEFVFDLKKTKECAGAVAHVEIALYLKGDSGAGASESSGPAERCR